MMQRKAMFNLMDKINKISKFVGLKFKLCGADLLFYLCQIRL